MIAVSTALGNVMYMSDNTIMTLQNLFQAYLQYLEVEKGYSPRTLRSYGTFLARFLEWSDAHAPQDITQDAITNFRLRLVRHENGRLSKKTQNYHLIALRGFLRFLIKREYKTLAPDQVELAKVPERQIDFLDENEMERLLAAPSGEDLRALRDKALLEMLFSTGLRVSELCALNRYDVDFHKDEFSTRGKGGKIRVVFLSPAAKKTLSAYMETRPDTGDALFIGIPRSGNPSLALAKKDAGRIVPRTVERIVKYYALKAGIARKVTPHTLRHMLGTQLLKGGANLRAVQMILGHANVATTQIYTHYANEELKEVHKKFLKRKRSIDTD